VGSGGTGICRAAQFEQLYRERDDPYGVSTRWYEQRKINVLMATLPCHRFNRAYEPGCGNGELTVRLAPRCGHVLASDLSASAVDRARVRTAGLQNVEVLQQEVPLDWPVSAGCFDLIVLSEISSYLSAAELHEVAVSASASLTDDGTLVACDWRPPFSGRTLDSDVAHQMLVANGLASVACHREPDFLLNVWSRAEPSIARRERIR